MMKDNLNVGHQQFNLIKIEVQVPGTENSLPNWYIFKIAGLHCRRMEYFFVRLLIQEGTEYFLWRSLVIHVLTLVR